MGGFSPEASQCVRTPESAQRRFWVGRVQVSHPGFSFLKMPFILLRQPGDSEPLCWVHATERGYQGLGYTHTWFGAKTHLSHNINHITIGFPLRRTMTKDKASTRLSREPLSNAETSPVKWKRGGGGHHPPPKKNRKIQTLYQFIIKNLRTFECVVLAAGVKLRDQRTAWKRCKINPPGSDLGLKLYPAGFCPYCLHKYIFCWSSGTKASPSKSVPSRRNIIKYQFGDNKMKGDTWACSRTYFNMPFTVHTGGPAWTHLLLVDLHAAIL